MSQDLYATIGISKGASEDEIKKAYRKKAKELHPDRNPDDPNAEKKFQELTNAYEILSDPKKRQNYDNYGSANGPGEFGGGGTGGFGGFGGFDDFGDISDMINDFFGGGGSGRKQSQSATRGNDLKYRLNISLVEAFEGLKKEINFKTFCKCTNCDGYGSADKKAPKPCGTCRGTGAVRQKQGFFIVETACPGCNGQGQVIANPCKSCSGQGRVEKNKTIDANIPAGIEDGVEIRLSGAGEAGVRNGVSGDLFIAISIKKHDFFTRRKNDLICTVPIRFTTAALGGEMIIPSIEGTQIKVIIPAGSQNDDKLKIPKKGMTAIRSVSRGDLFVSIQIETPVKLTTKQKELLEELDKSLSKDSNPKSNLFFDKIRKFF